MNFQRLLLGLFTGVLLAVTATASAQTTTTDNNPLTGCTDSGFYSKGRFITDVCWTCLFPMKIFGIPIPVGNRAANRLPASTAAPLCICPGRTFGIPAPGISWELWQPSHTIELVQKPWCSPILFGLNLGGSGMSSAATGIALASLRGTAPQGATSTESEAFYNFHWLSFPVNEMIDMLKNEICSPRGGVDMDYLYFTEFDPTWNKELLALYTHPEIKLFTKVYAYAACIADAVAATAYRPIQTTFWCAGAWGMSYPFSGNAVTVGDTVESQFLAATRGIAAMHRRGLAKLTYGNKAICSDRFWFVLPKQQYQLQNMWPWPERKQARWIGESSFKWGQWRKLPARFEDRVILQWRYQSCRITLW